MREFLKGIAFLSKENPLAFARDCLLLRKKWDRGALRRIQAGHFPATEKYSKYLRPSYFLLYNLYRSYSLGLQRSSALRILDIGCGAGYFAFICGTFGHDVQAIDVPDFPVFNEMVKALNVRRTAWRIKPLERLPGFGKRFDLITAFRTTFNLPTDSNAEENTWGCREWQFFLDDVMENLLERGGRIYLQLNRAGKYGAFYDQELLEFFKERAVSVDEGKILIMGAR